MLQAHWLKVYHSDYRKLQNMYRFVSEIMDGKLVISKKKKDVVVEMLRERKYEAFPRGKGAKKAKESDEDVDPEDEAEEEEGVGDNSAKDYDYLLSVRQLTWPTPPYHSIAWSFSLTVDADANLLVHAGTIGQAQEAD